MKFKIVNSAFDKITSDASIVFVVNENLKHKWVKDKKALTNLKYKGKTDESILITSNLNIYVGCEGLETEDIRQATAKAYSLLKGTNAKSVKVGLYMQACPLANIKAFVEAMKLASYEFTKYKSKSEKPTLKEVLISTEDYNGKKISQKNIKEAIKKGEIFADATNLTRDVVNTTPEDFTPLEMAKEAKKLARLKNVSCEVHDEKFLKKEGMNAFLAVNRASPIPPRLIHLTYKPKNAKKKIVYVGKGLTYDSGGLSLKPGVHMVTMKADKSGAAAVLGIIKGASELELPFEIHGIIGATENMIGGNAYKPDDVLKSRSGKTIEVRNTDAEGRLVLCDCLDYAQDFKPDLLIDMATLTGACVVALGEYTSGILGNNEELQNDFFQSTKRSGELTTPLFANKYLRKTLKSDIADVCNISNSRYGGAITAGIFLDNFIQDEYKDKWLHLDIAGPAFVEKNWGYNQSGASGAGVRMNLSYLLKLAMGH